MQMKNNLLISIILGVILFFVLSVWNRNKSDSDVVRKNTSLLKKEANTSSQNDLSHSKESTTKNESKESSHQINATPAQNLLLEDLTDEEVGFASIHCDNFNLTPEENLAKYIEMYETTRKFPPTQEQIIAKSKVVEKCYKISHFSKDLLAQNAANIESHKDNLLIEEATSTHNQNGEEAAFKFVEKYLFNDNLGTRETAQSLLLNQNWLKSIHKAYKIYPAEEKSFHTISIAMAVRECELDLRDCSINSFLSIHYCTTNPSFCGKNLVEQLQFELNGYQLEVLQIYLTYLRSLSS